MDKRSRSVKSSKRKRKKTSDFTVENSSKSTYIPNYNSLKDPNLIGFFANRDKRKLLYAQNLVIII